MSRMPLRPPMLNPESIEEHARFVPGTCTSGAIISENCKAADCPEHGLFPSAHAVAKGIAFSVSPQVDSGFASLERQTQMRGWRDSRGMPVTQWPQQLLPSATVIIVETFGVYTVTDWNILVHQRRDNGYWGFVGGRQEIGESIQECAMREAREETGLDVHLCHLTSIDSHPEHGSVVCYPDGNIVQYTNMTFLAIPKGGTLQCSHESFVVTWCRMNELPKPFLPSHMWRMQQVRSYGTSLELRYIR